VNIKYISHLAAPTFFPCGNRTILKIFLFFKLKTPLVHCLIFRYVYFSLNIKNLKPKKRTPVGCEYSIPLLHKKTNPFHPQSADTHTGPYWKFFGISLQQLAIFIFLWVYYYPSMIVFSNEKISIWLVIVLNLDGLNWVACFLQHKSLIFLERRVVQGHKSVNISLIYGYLCTFCSASTVYLHRQTCL